MAELAWRPWRVTVIGAGVAGATALLTALAMGVLSPPGGSSTPTAGQAPGVGVARGSVPSQRDVEACRDYARTFAPDRAGETASTEARYTQAYRACMKGRGFGGA